MLDRVDEREVMVSILGSRQGTRKAHGNDKT